MRPPERVGDVAGSELPVGAAALGASRTVAWALGKVAGVGAGTILNLLIPTPIFCRALSELRVNSLVFGGAAQNGGKMNRSEEERAIAEAAERLTKVFPGVSPDTVERAVAESRPEFDGNPIRDFVPLFVERSAKQRLRTLTTSDR